MASATKSTPIKDTRVIGVSTGVLVVVFMAASDLIIGALGTPSPHQVANGRTN